MEGHVIERSRGWFAFEQGNRDVVVAYRDTMFEVKFPAQSKHALEPFRTFLWITDSQPEVADHTKRKWRFHGSHITTVKQTANLQHTDEVSAWRLLLTAICSYRDSPAVPSLK